MRQQHSCRLAMLFAGNTARREKSTDNSMDTNTTREDSELVGWQASSKMQ